MIGHWDHLRIMATKVLHYIKNFKIILDCLLYAGKMIGGGLKFKNILKY